MSAGPAEQLLRISLELAAGARARANMIPFNIKTYQCPQGTFKRGGCFPGSEMLGRLGGSTACPCRGRAEKGRKPVQEHQDEQADGRKPRVNQKTHLMLWGPPAGATRRCLETTPLHYLPSNMCSAHQCGRYLTYVHYKRHPAAMLRIAP